MIAWPINAVLQYSPLTTGTSTSSVPRRDLAYRIAGEPEKVEFGERIVGIIESRDGTIMDVVRQIKPFQFKEEKKVLPESVHK